MNTKSLQKLTEQGEITQIGAGRIAQDGDVEKIGASMVEKVKKKQLTPEGRASVEAWFNKAINELTDVKRDNFLELISGVLSEDVKNQLWESNHYKITCAISEGLEEHGKMPTKNWIAKKTGLSRQTIHKHLAEYNSHPLYIGEIKKFKFMADRVLAKVFKLAVIEGDVKAMRLYLEATGSLGNAPGTTINTQNNYIQINQMRLSQDTIKMLSPDKLSQIEEILKSVIPGHDAEQAAVEVGVPNS